MDSLTEQDILEIRGGYRATIDYNYFLTAFAVAYVYHCLINLDEEVAYIWSRKWTLGKIVYLLTRYTPILYISAILTTVDPTRTFWSVESCAALTVYEFIARALLVALCDLSLSLCIYALLGAKRKYFALVGLLYFGFCIPITALLGVQMGHLASGSNAIPPEDRLRLSELDNRCLYALPDPSSYPISMAIAGLYCAGSIVNAFVGSAVLIIRYRRQSNSLVRSIRRDGGTYFLAACVFRILFTLLSAVSFIQGLSSDMMITASDAFMRIDFLLAPILSTAMLINMRKIDDEDSHTSISTLKFTSKDNQSNSTWRSGVNDDVYLEVYPKDK